MRENEREEQIEVQKDREPERRDADRGKGGDRET